MEQLLHKGTRRVQRFAKNIVYLCVYSVQEIMKLSNQNTDTPRLRKPTEPPLLIEGTDSPFEGGINAQTVLCAFPGDVRMRIKNLN